MASAKALIVASAVSVGTRVHPWPRGSAWSADHHPLGETGDRILVGRELASPRDQPLPSCGSRMSRGQGGQLSVRSRLGNTNYHCYRNSLICYTLTPCGSGFHRYQSRRGRERADNPPRAPSSWPPSQESGLGLSTLPARVESAALPPATRSLSPRHTHVPRPQRCHPCTGTRAPASRGDV